MEKSFETVKLNDGREVKVTELTGLDEMIAAKVVGKEMDNTTIGTVQMRYVLLAFSIAEIDGKPVKRPTNINDVRVFLGGFTSKQIAKIGNAYSRLNDFNEDEESKQGENSAAELSN